MRLSQPHVLNKHICFPQLAVNSLNNIRVMSDSNDDSKSASSPSWQSNPEDSQQNAASQEDRDTLETARRFLAEESIRDAPIDKKIAFLESKGVKSEDIQALLGVSQGAEFSATHVCCDSLCLPSHD